MQKPIFTEFYLQLIKRGIIMRRIMLFLALCLLLTGCADKASNGGFGGNPYVENTGKKTTARMLRIDGELYYDTGTVSDNTPRCGTLDGGLEKGVDEFEVPQKDGQTNFEPTNTNYFGYQAGFDKYTVEVPLDGEWVIFRKITDPEFDENKYRYCMHLKGTMPNAAAETDMIVLADDKELDFAKVTKSMFSSLLSDHIDKYVIIPNGEDLGIALSAEDVTPTGCRLIIRQSGGYPSGELQTGSWYEIEKLDDGWKPVDTVITNYAWTAIAYLIPKDGKYEAEINWEWLYGELKPGNYRLAKEIMDFRGSGDFDKRIFYAYFEIE